ncbi:hypothetical protein B0H14DRAFT_1647722 [Mycena olivaceomarginata]|nr:hypothetical protein B0H14DRAFT_1647722 [Mycena olivaceomarginata]
MPLDSASPSPVVSISDISDAENGLPSPNLCHDRAHPTIQLQHFSPTNSPTEPNKQPPLPLRLPGIPLRHRNQRPRARILNTPPDIHCAPLFVFSCTRWGRFSPLGGRRAELCGNIYLGGTDVHVHRETDSRILGPAVPQRATVPMRIEQDIMKARAPFVMLPSAPAPGDQCIRGVSYEFYVSRSTAPPVSRTTASVFHLPALPSEPPLAPGFPAVGYTSQLPNPMAPPKYPHHTLDDDSELEKLPFYAAGRFVRC